MPFNSPFASSGPEIPPPPGSSRPPSYNRATRPTPAPPPAPTQYGSLRDLSKGNAQPGQSYQYTAQPERVGYRPQVEERQSYGSAGATGAGGRHMPPPPSTYGKEIPREPPRRTVGAHAAIAEESRTTPAAPAQSGWRGAASTAGSYVPNSVSATATSVADRARDGVSSVFTQERRDQVMSGAGKAAAGAAKLAAKGAWSLGKFASGNK